MSYFGVMACCSRSGVIGCKGRIPWNYPRELTEFRTRTKGKVRIMGYYTYFSMPEHALANRINIVFSRVHKQEKPNCPAQFVSSWEEFTQLKLSSGCMIGGGQIANLFLEKNALQCIYLTRIAREFPGDAFFPLHLIEHWSAQIVSSTSEYKIYKYENPSYPHSSRSS